MKDNFKICITKLRILFLKEIVKVLIQTIKIVIMNLSISGFYTEPKFNFKLSDKLFKYLSDQLSATIMIKQLYQKTKFNELELYIYTDGKSINHRAEHLFKNSKNKDYLSYALWLPYPKIVKTQKTHPDLFVQYFFKALKDIFSFYDIDTQYLPELEYKILQEIKNNSEYDYIPSENMSKWNDALNNYYQNK